ncbi:hypothetical protein AS026_02460 [Rhizobium altiplani]|uniref:Uncharacterized protein n=1 Tax=Rhizobium altiplani TaxID=1864509 RepID=A0A109JS99_9HYPH|nr:hypothetical protein AS026_02460 [Rhizobium altiplani]
MSEGLERLKADKVGHSQSKALALLSLESFAASPMNDKAWEKGPGGRDQTARSILHQFFLYDVSRESVLCLQRDLSSLSSAVGLHLVDFEAIAPEAVCASRRATDDSAR